MSQSTALLNWSSQYSNISPFLQAVAGSTDWLRVFVSPDATGGGHFITHGIDFGATYIGGRRGLVPANSGTLNKTFLRGDGWSSLWTAADEVASAVGDTTAQQIAAKELYMQTTLASVYDIKQWIAQSFAANNAMRFKGIITIDSKGNISTTTEEGTINNFPTECLVGDTYKINGETRDASSYIGGQYVGTGDMVICIKSGSGANLNDAQYWTIVQDNIEHLITYTLNGVAHHIYAQSGNDVTIYATDTSGNRGQELISAGDKQAPIWAKANTLVVLEANHVTNALTAGTGIRMTNQGVAETSYNGSAAITITLNPATTSTIGGILIDNGTNSEKYHQPSNTGLKPYPTISVNSNGQIYLTKANIVNALGYDPISALPIFNDTTDGLVPMSSAANKSNTPAISTTYLLGADAKWYKLPTSAFQSDRRIINLNGTTIIAADSGNALDIIAGNHVNITAIKASGNYTGALTFEAVWRDIQVRLISDSGISQNVSSIGDNNPLVFDNTDTVFMLGEEVQVGSTTKTVIKSYITWYNMDTGEYEMI